MPQHARMTPDGLARVRSRFAIPAPGLRKVVSLRPAADLHCETCGVRGLCIPTGLGEEALHALAHAVGNPVRVARREVLYRAGQASAALYAVHLGSFKSVVFAENGREQMTDYHMVGSMLGLDGLGQALHSCDMIALEDSEVCALSHATLDDLTVRLPLLHRSLLRLLSRDLRRAKDLILLLGQLSAEERLASFLLDLAEHHRERGYSQSEFVLRMTREEIASYLGLQLETVSRVFSRLHGEGLIQVQGRAIKVLDAAGLRHLKGDLR